MNNNMEFLSALTSKSANRDLKKVNNLFGQFVGEWDFDWYGYGQDLEAQHETGEWIFSWVLEGRWVLAAGRY